MSHAHAHAHGHGHGHSPDDAIQFTQEFWDERYGSSGRLFSGQPNSQLRTQIAGLPPGEALDAGSGEGADAIWLARQGWTVTAVDVSAVALERAADDAAQQGDEIAGRITWRREDLLSWAPDPERFDLVSAQFMHLPVTRLEDLHRRLAAAVRPGGTLLVVLHHPDDLPASAALTGQPDMFRSAAQMAQQLEPSRWEILVAGDFGRQATDPDGQPVTVRDTVLRARRAVG